MALTIDALPDGSAHPPTFNDLLPRRDISETTVSSWTKRDTVASLLKLGSVENIAALASIPVTQIPDKFHILVLGGTTANDGNGGIFFFSASASDTADAMTIVSPSGGSGRWFRIAHRETDPELIALSGVASATNTVPYFTGTGTASVTALTVAGRTLIGGADAAAQRTSLGLGSAAVVATSAFEAAGAIATHNAITSGAHGISAFGATLIDDPDAAAARTTLGLGSAATSATSAFEASGAVATHNAVTSGAHGISAFGATLIDDSSAAVARATLQLSSSDAVTFSSVSDAAGKLRAIPQNAQSSSYTLVLADTGKHVASSSGGVTVPQSIFSAGDAVTIVNNSGSSQTITQGSGVTMYLAGSATTGNRTLAQRGVATVLCTGSNTFIVAGAGLT